MENEIDTEGKKTPKQEPRIETEGTSTAKKVKIGLGVALVVVLVLLVLFNREPIRVSLIFWEIRTPLFLLIPIVFLLGMIAGYVIRRK